MKGTLKRMSLLCVMSVFILSCGGGTQKKNQIETVDEIDKILIQFYPSFDQPSIMLFDLPENQVSFLRFDGKINIPGTDESTRQAADYHVPGGVVFSLNPQAYAYVKDSIVFDRHDFTNRSEFWHDGIGHTISYAFKNGGFKDIHLNNSLTQNQRSLIINLINAGIGRSADSMTVAYLKNLREYH